MVRRFSISEKDTILDYAYARERENLFIIGSLSEHRISSGDVIYFGSWHKGTLSGIGAFFDIWGSLVINAPEVRTIEALVDFAAKNHFPIKWIPAFRRYAEVMIERLRSRHHLAPKKVSQETVMILARDDFRDFSRGQERLAEKGEIDALIYFNRENGGFEVNAEIHPNERKAIIPGETFLMAIDNRIVAKANIHGSSRNYFQIGGVGTLAAYRNRGYAKQVMSALCRHYFSSGLPFGLLFTGKDNGAAQKVYRDLGFKEVDEFIIAEYEEKPYPISSFLRNIFG